MVQYEHTVVATDRGAIVVTLPGWPSRPLLRMNRQDCGSGNVMKSAPFYPMAMLRLCGTGGRQSHGSHGECREGGEEPQPHRDAQARRPRRARRRPATGPRRYLGNDPPRPPEDGTAAQGGPIARAEARAGSAPRRRRKRPRHRLTGGRQGQACKAAFGGSIPYLANPWRRCGRGSGRAAGRLGFASHEALNNQRHPHPRP